MFYRSKKFMSSLMSMFGMFTLLDMFLISPFLTWVSSFRFSFSIVALWVNWFIWSMLCLIFWLLTVVYCSTSFWISESFVSYFYNFYFFFISLLISKESSSSSDSASGMTVALEFAYRRLVGPSRVTLFSLFLWALANMDATDKLSSDSDSVSFRYEISNTLSNILLCSSESFPCRPSELSLLSSYFISSLPSSYDELSLCSTKATDFSNFSFFSILSLFLLTNVEDALYTVLAI